MTLYTRSIKEKPSKKDGVRICIMRHPDKWAKYDIWMPQLSPSQKLRDEVKKGIGWAKFKVKFLKEMRKEVKFIDFVAGSAMKNNVTLLCVEDNPFYCHRSLLAKEIKKKYHKLKVMIR